MEIVEMVKENNSIMQLLMENQCYLELIIGDVTEKLNEDFENNPDQLQNLLEIRRQVAEKYYKDSMKKLKAILEKQ
jgi:hypothetical protein